MATERESYNRSEIRYTVPEERPRYRVDGEPLGPYTYADYAQTPDDERYELIQGFLVRDPSPFYDHQALSVELTVRAGLWAEEDGRTTVFHAPFDVALDDYNVLQPDLLIFRDRKHKDLTRRGLTAPPDLVCEILSPSTRHRDTGVKLQLYSKFGVAEYWIIDPRERKISRYVANRHQGYLETEGEYFDGELRSSAFPTFSIDVSKLFAVLDRFK